MIAIAIWAMSYLWSNRLVMDLQIPVEFIVCVRSIVAGVLLFLFNIVIRQSIRIRKKDLGWFIGLALCEPAVYFLLETYGIKFTSSPTYSALVVATSPIFSCTAGIVFFKEKITRMNILGIIICILGLVLVILNGDKDKGTYFILGMSLLLLAVIVEVGYAIFTKKLSEIYSSSVITMYQFLIGGLLLAPLAYFRTAPVFDAAHYFSWEVWKPLLCLSVLCSCIAFTMWAAAIKYLGVAKASVFVAMIPVFTAIFGVITGTEVLTIIQWMGICIAFSGLILTQRSKG